MGGGANLLLLLSASPKRAVDVMLQTIVLPEGKNSEGELIRAVALPWWEIVRRIERDPGFL